MPDNNLIQNCTSCSAAWKNFSHLTKKELQYLNENRYEAHFKPGEIIIKQGSPTSNAIFLSKGMAKVYMEGFNGKNFILSIAKPGRLIMGPGAYTNLRNTYTVSAITAVFSCFISFDVFHHLIKTNSAFAESLIEDISAKALRTHNKMLSLTQKKMPGRLAESLLYFSDEVFHSDEFEMILTRQEIGEMSNMAKESVVRILKDFEVAGIISSSASRISILDKNKLIAISECG
jgi:CRP/FNR family transcriptional regulator, polysaccharide utilization system transcription regulator